KGFGQEVTEHAGMRYCQSPGFCTGFKVEIVQCHEQAFANSLPVQGEHHIGRQYLCCQFSFHLHAGQRVLFIN
ncbi:hypothetical protein CBL20_24815, partial [Shigella flexneri]